MIYDISPLIDESVAVWPGDTSPKYEDLRRIGEEESGIFLSTLTLSCHTGAHADAPNHFLAGAPGIDEVPIERYIGECQLVDVQPRGNAICPEDLHGVEIVTPRVLFRTGCYTDRTVFPDPLTCLTPELVQTLALRRVVLVGLDSPSVDPFDSRDLPVHKALHEHGMSNLESLQLASVPAGRYELIALPLRLKGRDASPVRAILRTL